MNFWGFAGVLLGVGVLIFLICFHRTNVLLASIVGVLIIIVLNQLPVWDTFTEVYADGIGGWIKDFLIIFTFGALLGRILMCTGCAQAIGMSLIKKLGIKHVGLIIHILSLLLVYAGVDFLVAVLSIAPISIAMVREANLPRRFAIACLLGGGCSYVFGLPGSSSVNNLLPTSVLGTSTLAAWLPGLLGSAVTLAITLLYQKFLEKKLRKSNAGFELSVETVEKDFGSRDESQLPPPWIGYAALFIVVFSSLLLGGTNVIAPKAAISGGLAAASVFTLLLGRRYLNAPLPQVLENGAVDGIIGVILSGAMLGFVEVIQSTQSFTAFANWISGIDLPPLLGAVFTIQMMNLILANSPGSLSIFLDSFGPQLLAAGIQPAILHRVTTMSCASFAAMMPHNSTSVVCLQTYKASYGECFADVAIICIAAPLIGTLATVAFISIGIV